MELSNFSCQLDRTDWRPNQVYGSGLVQNNDDGLDNEGGGDGDGGWEVTALPGDSSLNSTSSKGSHQLLLSLAGAAVYPLT